MEIEDIRIVSSLIFASFMEMGGVFPNPSTNLQVLEGGGLTLTVRKGRAWVNGQIHLGDEDIKVIVMPQGTIYLE